MSLASQLHEATGDRLDTISASEARRINADLDKKGFGGQQRFRSIGQALNIADTVLGKHGLEYGQVNSASLFRGDSGHRSIVLARKTSDPFSPVEIRNRALGFQWTKMDDGRYEVIAYLG